MYIYISLVLETYQEPQVHLERVGTWQCYILDLANNYIFFFAIFDVGFSMLSQGVIPLT